jgi:hypothetical protein
MKCSSEEGVTVKHAQPGDIFLLVQEMFHSWGYYLPGCYLQEGLCFDCNIFGYRQCLEKMKNDAKM